MPHDQKIVKDERGQEQPADKKRAQQDEQNTAKEGGGAYAPHDDGERANPDRDPAKKKAGEF